MEYTWTLNDWFLLYNSTYKKRVTSTNFNFNGTIGCTCQIRLSPMTPDKGLTIEFSDTQVIKEMQVHYCFGNFSSSPTRFCQPILNNHTYSIDYSLIREKLRYPLTISNPLVIVINITIVEISDAISVSPAALSPSTFCTHDSPPRNSLVNFKTMFDRKAFCDVTFVLGDKTFYVHKVVLAVQSKVFEAMFLSDMKEQNNKIEISDTDAEAFEQFLNYLYGGNIIRLQEMVEEMIVIADFYNVSDLKIKCENVMLKSLSKSSAIRYVILADKFQYDALKKAALHLIRNSTMVLEKALLEEDIVTMTCLKEILSKNPPTA